MTEPTYIPDPDADAIEAAVRKTLEPPCSVERVWQRLAESARAAEMGVRVPRARARAYRWWVIAGAALAASVLLALFAYHHFTPEPRSVTRQPAPVAGGGSTLPVRSVLPRGSEVTTTDQKATLDLGGYCRIEVAPNSGIRVTGDERAESVALTRGQVICEITPGVGSFQVQSAVATVTVRGTRFRATLHEPGEGNPAPPARLTVAVTDGSVAVEGPWGATVLAAGDEKTFGPRGVLGVPPPAPIGMPATGSRMNPGPRSPQ